MSVGAQTSRLAVLVFTDVVGSSELKNRLGVLTYAKLLARHDAIFRELLAEFPSAEVLQDTGDGFFAAFQTVGDAVRFALRFQDAMHREPWGTSEPFQTRVGIHLGELAHVAGISGGPQKVVGIAADLTHRVMTLACGGQILLTRAAFDEARQFVSEYPSVNGLPPRALRWMAHGDYVFHGAAEPVQVFEVGGDGIAPLSPPRDREKARRSRSEDNKDEILGWRPAIGLAVPQAPAWVLERKLGEGTFGEVWLAHHATLRQKRVFKFCFDAQRLESFKRELTLFRLLRDALGERPDIARLHDVCFDRPPFFLETEYAPAGNLIDWAAAQGGLDRVPLETRLEIVAQVCDAVAAAHSVGVLHKDIKPSNILMRTGTNGAWRPQLADFGIGLLTDKSQLAARQITEAGFTSMDAVPESSRSGTRIYMPPEALVGRPFTTLGDIYALGVLLYQMTIADLSRPMALGWERDVPDELLREDIADCVDGDPARRVNSAADLATRLRELPKRHAKRDAELRERLAAQRRRHVLRIAAVAVALLVATVGVIAYTSVQRQRLRTSQREVEWAHATMGLEKGIAAHFSGRGQPSRAAFAEARQALERLGISTLPADVGIYRSLREFDAPVNVIQAGDDGIMAVAWIPGGDNLIASAAEDGTVRSWDARTGRLVQTFEGHKGLVGALAASPDGKHLLSGGHDKTIRLWDVETGRCVRAMTESGGEVRGVAFSPNGKFAASSSYGNDPEVRIWNLETGEAVRSFPSPDRLFLYGITYAPDGSRIAVTAYGAGDTWVWDVQGDRPPTRLPGSGQYSMSVAFSADGTRLLTAGFDNVVHLWDARSGQRIRTLRGHSAGVRGVAFLDDAGTRALSCSMDAALNLWDLETGEVLRSFAGHTGGIRGLAVSPDRRYAVSGAADHKIHVWNLQASPEVPTIMTDAGTKVTAMGHTGDGLVLAVGDELGAVALYDVATQRLLRRYAGLDRPIECVQPLPDGRLIAADHRGCAVMWDLASGNVLLSYSPRAPAPEPEDGIRGKDWCYSTVARDGSLVVASNADRHNLDVWSLETGKTLSVIGPHANNIRCVAISPDGRRLLSGDMNGDVYYWDLKSRAMLFKDRIDKQGSLDAVAISADGKVGLAGGHANVVRAWDLASGRAIQAFTGHTSVVRAVGFGRGDATVFSASSDQTLRMFETATGREFELGASFPVPLYALMVLPPGDAVAAASGAAVSVWDISRALRYIRDELRVSAAQMTLRNKPDDAAALATLGDWYAFRGMDEWATRTLEQARSAGAKISSVALARCYWRLGRRLDASREFRLAIAQNETSAAYLNTCLDAVENPGRQAAPASGPASRP